MGKRKIIYCPECGAGKEYNEHEGRCLYCGADLTGMGHSGERRNAPGLPLAWEEKTEIDND